MSKRTSYARYRQYRKNQRRYAFETNIIPCLIVFMIFLNVLKSLKWFFWGVAVLVIVYIGIVAIKGKKRFAEAKETDGNHDEDIKIIEGKRRNMNTTDTGYINKNNQKNMGKTNQQGTDYKQYFYAMECLNCGHVYKANGSDIWLRKCPKCQGGRQ